MKQKITAEPLTNTDNGRNYGIDLLRLVSMFLVVLLHATGAVRKSAEAGTSMYEMIYLLRTLCFPCVDIFAIISGYVGWKHRLSINGVAGTWLLVVWHTVLITGLTALLKPEWLPKEAWKRAFLPVSTKEYWYVTAYFMMLLFIPLIHFILKRISTALLWIWVGSFLFVHSFLSTLNWKAYGMKRGYNFFWLIGMYLLGAAMERSKKLWEAHAKLIGAALFMAGAVPAYLLIVLADNRNWIDYCSPLTILSAVGAVICFSGMKMQRISRAIRMVSPTALAIFVIHVHTITWNHVFYSWPRSHGLWKTASSALMCANLIGWALTVFFICIFLDLFRIRIFSLLRIPRALKAADNGLEKLLRRFRRS